MKELYEKYVVAHSNSFKRVVLDPQIVSQVKELANKIAMAKSQEKHHLIDSNKEAKRFTTGLLGEAALEKVLGISIIDWSIGDSNKYHTPDIPGYNVGIKTVERNKFPIIFKKNHYPQIICIKSDRRDDLIFVCGLATKDILNRYQDDNLILDPNLRSRNTKTGFYGFEHLIPIRSLDELSNYKKKEE